MLRRALFLGFLFKSCEDSSENYIEDLWRA